MNSLRMVDEQFLQDFDANHNKLKRCFKIKIIHELFSALLSLCDATWANYDQKNELFAAGNTILCSWRLEHVKDITMYVV